MNKQTGKYTALTIAYYYIFENNIIMNSFGADGMSLSRLQKLLYFADGGYYAIYGQPLINEDFYASKFGPAIARLENKTGWDYKSVITVPDASLRLITSAIEKQDKEYLHDVFGSFGSYSAMELKNETCEAYPWLNATNNGTIFGKTINKEEIKKNIASYYNIDKYKKEKGLN